MASLVDSNAKPRRLAKLSVSNSLDFPTDKSHSPDLITSKSINDLIKHEHSASKSHHRAKKQTCIEENSDLVPIFILSKSKKLYARDTAEKKSKLNYIKQMQQHELKSHQIQSLKPFEKVNYTNSDKSNKQAKCLPSSSKSSYDNLEIETSKLNKSKNLKHQVCFTK